jgi:hypothetical protein
MGRLAVVRDDLGGHLIVALLQLGFAPLRVAGAKLNFRLVNATTY